MPTNILIKLNQVLSFKKTQIMLVRKGIDNKLKTGFGNP
jgi:hypothetical protein